MSYEAVLWPGKLAEALTARYRFQPITTDLIEEINQYAQTIVRGDYEIVFSPTTRNLVIQINTSDPKMITWWNLLQ